MFQKIRAKRGVPELYEEKLVVSLAPRSFGKRQATLYDILLTSCYTVLSWNDCRPKAHCLKMLRCLYEIHTKQLSRKLSLPPRPTPLRWRN